MTQPQVKLATIEDLPWIRHLWRQMVAEGGPPYPTNIMDSIDSFTRSLALALTMSPPQAFVFLATFPGSQTPDAFLAYEIQTRQLGSPSRLAFVHYCYVKPEMRSMGVASTFALLLVEHVEAQGLSVVEITTLPGQTLWEDLGFIPFETRHHATTADILAGAQARHRRHGNGATDEFAVPPPLSDDEGE